MQNSPRVRLGDISILGCSVGGFATEDTDTSRQSIVSHRNAKLLEAMKTCFVDLVDMSARKSGFHHIWTSRPDIRALFYVRVIRQMHGMAKGSSDNLTHVEDGELQGQFDVWRLLLCHMSLVPPCAITRLLTTVLRDGVAGDLDGAPPRRRPATPVSWTSARTKVRYSVGELMPWWDEGTVEAADALLEQAIAEALGRPCGSVPS